MCIFHKLITLSIRIQLILQLFVFESLLLATSVIWELEFDMVVQSNTLSSAGLINNATKQAQIVFVVQTALTHVANAVYQDNVSDSDYTAIFTGVTNNDDSDDDATDSQFEHDITVTFDLQTEVK